MSKRWSLQALWKKAYWKALRKGASEEKAEDFASWLVVKRMEGKSDRQHLSHALIDYLREEGSLVHVSHYTYERGSRFMRAGGSFIVPLDDAMSSTSNTPFEELEERLDARKKVHKLKLTETEWEILRDMFWLDKTQRDKAADLGVSESRVAQILTAMRKRLAKQRGGGRAA